VPRDGTTWPSGHDTPPPLHRAYPIVLAHGFSGFHNIGPLNYFYGVQDALSKDGHEVYVTQVDPYNSSEVRGAELQQQVEDILAKTGSPKVNLVCHSQGALDCRYVANQLGG
jgi:triacylglycerol lipase